MSADFHSPVQTKLIKPSDLASAAEMLRLGKLVAFPTDTFFALGAVLREDAVKALFDAKGRMAGNPVPVLLSSAEQVSQVSSEGLHGAAAALAKAFWPGPLTLVLPASAAVPAAVTTGTGSVGLRVPDHDLARKLIGLVGAPATGTSANVSGRDPCKTSKEVMAQLGGVIAAVVDGPCGAHSAPSTVVGFDGTEIRILRHGSISESAIRENAANS